MSTASSRNPRSSLLKCLPGYRTNTSRWRNIPEEGSTSWRNVPTTCLLYTSQYLYDLAIESVSVSERLRHLLHSKVELISLKKLFTRTGHFHTAVAEFYLDKCLLLVEAEIELVNFGVQYPGTITTPSSFLSSLHWKGSLVNLMELISSLDYSGLITDESGKRLSFCLLYTSRCV